MLCVLSFLACCQKLFFTYRLVLACVLSCRLIAAWIGFKATELFKIVLYFNKVLCSFDWILLTVPETACCDCCCFELQKLLTCGKQFEYVLTAFFLKENIDQSPSVFRSPAGLSASLSALLAISPASDHVDHMLLLSLSWYTWIKKLASFPNTFREPCRSYISLPWWTLKC